MGLQERAGGIPGKVPLKLRLAAALVVSYSAQTLLITASKRQKAAAAAQPPSNNIVLISELVKLSFALFMVTRMRLWRQVWAQPVWLSLCFALPGLLYSLQNNLVFLALSHLTPGLYQLFNNIKIVTTAVAFRLVVRRELKVIQWLALALLTVGMAVTVHVGPECRNGGKEDGGAGQPPPPPPSAPSITFGLAIMVFMSFCSALASVSNEVLIKRSPSVYVANVWLYAFGVLGNASYLLVAAADGGGGGGPGGLLPRRLLSGFSGLTWSLVFVNAFMGQSVAFIFRYADVIVKIYATSAAVAFTAAASWALFGIRPSAGLAIGYLICVCSICLYYLDSKVLYTSDAEVLQWCCGSREEVSKSPEPSHRAPMRESADHHHH